jgi:2',3'-cyclic-nucleotide 2'-phosphodiesterase (5'-nucleotidase family)
VARHARTGLRDLRGRAIDLILTGHTHDLFINYDGRTAMVESSYDAHYVTAVDVAIDVKEKNGRRRTTWWPQFRVIDTATVAADPEVAAVVATFEGDLSRQLDTPIGTTAIELDSRSATVRTRAGRDRRPHRRRDALVGADRRGG